MASRKNNTTNWILAIAVFASVIGVLLFVLASIMTTHPEWYGGFSAYTAIIGWSGVTVILASYVVLLITLVESLRDS